MTKRVILLKVEVGNVWKSSYPKYETPKEANLLHPPLPFALAWVLFCMLSLLLLKLAYIKESQ